nr:septal ring lytic transglycosylase RlpA family protein [uncultured Lacibacter sp.]
MKKFCLLFVLFLSVILFPATAQRDSNAPVKKTNGKPRIQYGMASFYSNKFNGRKTANGEIFSNQKMTAAHNTLPLGTYVRVTNLRNGRKVVVKINDRLHHKNKRIIDLSRTAASKLGFLKSGLTRVKIEVLGKKPPEK